MKSKLRLTYFALGLSVSSMATLVPEDLRAEPGRPTAGSGDDVVEWQADVAGVAPELRRRLGSNFAGIWFDAERSDVVTVAVTDIAAFGTRALTQELLPHGAGMTTTTRIVARRYPLEKLEATFEDVVRLASMSAAVDAPNVTAGINEEANVVRVTIPSDSVATARQRELMRILRERHGDRIEIIRDDSVIDTDVCQGDYCDQPLRAGVGIGYNTSSGLDRRICTAGFFGRSLSDNKLYLLTAGHCVRNRRSRDWFTLQPHTGLASEHYIGRTHNFVYGAEGDVGIIRVANPNWRARQWVYVRSSADTTRNEAYSIKAVAYPIEGQRVCMAGMTTNTRCGRVDTARSMYVESRTGVTISSVSRATYCSDPGDSGAPVFSTNARTGQRTAWGIHSGSRRDDSLCSDDNRSYFTRATVIPNRLNVRIPLDG